MHVRSLVAIFAIALLPFSQSFGHGDHATVGTTPAGGLGGASKKSIDTPIEIHDRYGKAYFYETPSNDEEKYINLGYSSLNVFHYLDAYRAFKAAYVENKNSVQALVGLILSIHQQARSQAEVKLAGDYYKQIEKIKSHHGLSKKDEAWVGIVAALYFNEGTPTDAVKKLQAEDGDNIEFLASLNWILMNSRARSSADAIADFKKVLTKKPNHAGANHFLLHMSESANDIPAAQAYGKVLIKSAVGSAHGQHMYGHTLPQVGKWQEAMTTDRRATGKAIGLALSEDNFQLAKKLIDDQKANNPSSMVLFEQEINFLKDGTPMTKFAQDAYSQIVQIFLAVKGGQAQFVQHEATIENFFKQSLTSGGFDGWSHAFVDLLRLRNIAKKLGVNEFVKMADDIDAKAKAGTL
jgi:hypothetical protein